MNIVKGLFFDLDGTLVDTLDANAKAYVKAVESIGRRFSEEMYHPIHGMRVDLFMRKYFPDITEEELEEVRVEKARCYPDFLHLARPHQPLIDFIRTLREQHTTVLVTMAQRKNTEAVLDAAGIKDLFDHIITGNDVTHAKPDPESYLHALKITRLKPSEALAFEDSDSGIEAAKAAGIPVIAIQIPRATVHED